MGLKTFIKRRFTKEEEIYYKLNDLQRFVKIQERDYQRALSEIRQGLKTITLDLVYISANARFGT